MKKVFVFTLAALLAIGGLQAQNKKAAPAPKTKVVLSDANAGAKPAKGLKKEDAKSSTAKKEMKKKIDFLATMPLEGPREMGLEKPLFKALMERRTVRDFIEEEMPKDMLASLLWSVYGFNRPEDGKRVVPSACNSQEFDIYLFDREGIWLYDAEKEMLGLVAKGDHRAEISKQEHFAVAPVSLVLVANYDRMEKIKEQSDREFYAAVDAGYISQDIYLWCASAGFGTVACGAINRDNLNLLLNITNGKAILAHPVGRVK